MFPRFDTISHKVRAYLDLKQYITSP
jgi:hypothetical protein